MSRKLATKRRAVFFEKIFFRLVKPLTMKKLSIIILSIVLLAPISAAALDMPGSANDLAQMTGVSAEAYIVIDAKTGQPLISKNTSLKWTPASLTKLVTALVVLDTKPKLTKTVAMTKEDQVVGGCSQGGACIKSAVGVKFTVDGLFHAALMPSANNAANALSRSSGLSKKDFVDKMNAKALELGATNTYFYEPTGMDPENKTTAEDFAKIAKAAFANSYIKSVAGTQTFKLKSSNNTKYNQNLKNTNKLLKDPDIAMLAAKTGYLDESGYNFSSLVKTFDGSELIVVVLGEKHLSSAFAETKQLAGLAQVAKVLSLSTPAGMVLGINN